MHVTYVQSILWGSFTDNGTIVWLHWCQNDHLQRYGGIDQSLTNQNKTQQSLGRMPDCDFNNVDTAHNFI